MRLARSASRQARVDQGSRLHGDVGRMLPPAAHPYRYVATRGGTPPTVRSSSRRPSAGTSTTRHSGSCCSSSPSRTSPPSPPPRSSATWSPAPPSTRSSGTALAAEGSDGEQLPARPRRQGRRDHQARHHLQLPAGADPQLEPAGTSVPGRRLPRAALSAGGDARRARDGAATAAHRRPDRRRPQSLSGQVERLIALSNALLELEELDAQTAALEDGLDVTELVDAVVVQLRRDGSVRRPHPGDRRRTRPHPSRQPALARPGPREPGVQRVAVRQRHHHHHAPRAPVTGRC